MDIIEYYYTSAVSHGSTYMFGTVLIVTVLYVPMALVIVEVGL